MGLTCVEYDIVNGQQEDLTSGYIWDQLYKDIEAGRYDAMLAGPPCNTFTNARKNDGRGSRPLRGPTGPDRYGYQNLKPAEKDKVRTGTLLAVRTAKAVKSFTRQRKPTITEQPKWRNDEVRVSMYNLDEFAEFHSSPDFGFKEVAQCEYGAAATKPTTLMVGLLPEATTQAKCTHPRMKLVKPSTGETRWAAHPPLVGKEWYIKAEDWSVSMLRTPEEIKQREKDMPFLTSAAQAYPEGLNKWLAETLVNGIKDDDPGEVFVRSGRWSNTLKRRKLNNSQCNASFERRLHFTTPLRGQGQGHDDEECQYWGGMRRPLKIVRELPGYRVAGHKLCQLLQQHLQQQPELLQRCLGSIGLDSEDAGPTAEQLNEVADKINQLYEDVPKDGRSGLRTQLRAELLWKIARAFGDPDADAIHEWLTEGAPAGISRPIEDPGNIFPPDGGEQQLETLVEIPDPARHVNYSSVDGDPDAEPEVQRLIATGFVQTCQTLKEFETWLQGKPHLSKLGMITKTLPNGRIKRRLILDCRQSGVNELASKGGKLTLPRIADAVEDALNMMNLCKGHETAEWLIMDFTDWFFNIPLRPAERKHFTLAYKHNYVAYLTQAQGSVNAPLICGRVAAQLARLTQALFGEQTMRMELYVDDPILCVRGDQNGRDLIMATTILFWATLGVRLAYKKASRGASIQWIGATLTMLNQGEQTSRLEVRAKPEIVEEVRKMTDERMRSNVVPKKSLQTYVGKLNHIAGIVEVLRPFLTDLYGVLHATSNSMAPTNCFWSKQWRHVTVWMEAFLKNEQKDMYREYRLAAYFGHGIRVEVITDASPWGLGGYITADGTILSYYASAINAEDERILGITVGQSAAQQIVEALAVLVALKMWQALWSRPRVRLQIKSDSVGALTMLAKLRSTYRSSGLSLIARELALLFGTSSYRPKLCSHIPGLSNDWADALSRLTQPGQKKHIPEAFQKITRTVAPNRDTTYYATYLTARQGNR